MGLLYESCETALSGFIMVYPPVASDGCVPRRPHASRFRRIESVEVQGPRSAQKCSGHSFPFRHSEETKTEISRLATESTMSVTVRHGHSTGHSCPVACATDGRRPGSPLVLYGWCREPQGGNKLMWENVNPTETQASVEQRNC